MGLGMNERDRSRRLRIGIGGETGKERAVVAERCTKDTPGARPVIKADGEHVANRKTGELLYRKEYDYVEGTISGLESTSDDWGKYLDVHIEDGSSVFVLRIDRGDRFWADFVMRLPLVQLAHKVRLAPYSFKSEDGKLLQGIVIYQNGEKITRKWNKENGYEGGPPEATYDADEEKWQFGKRNRWLEENVVQAAIDELSVLRAGKEQKPAAPTAAAPAPAAPAPAEDDDDLPF